MSKTIEPIKVSGKYGYISLPNGMVAQIDAECARIPAVNGWPWYVRKERRAGKVVLLVYRDNKLLYPGESALLANVLLGQKPRGQAVHINGNMLDFRLKNLRWKTDEEISMALRGPRKRRNA